MDVKSTAKTLRIPPRKARLVLDIIRGKNVEEAGGGSHATLGSILQRRWVPGERYDFNAKVSEHGHGGQNCMQVVVVLAVPDAYVGHLTCDPPQMHEHSFVLQHFSARTFTFPQIVHGGGCHVGGDHDVNTGAIQHVVLLLVWVWSEATVKTGDASMALKSMAAWEMYRSHRLGKGSGCMHHLAHAVRRIGKKVFANLGSAQTFGHIAVHQSGK